MLKLLLFLLFCPFSIHASIIHNYQKIYLPMFNAAGEVVIALRIFKINHQTEVLVVNTDNLKTEVQPLQKLYLKNPQKTSPIRSITHKQLQTTRFYQLFFLHTQEKQGVKHALGSINDNILTVDLCPSSHPFEKDFFDALANSKTQPFPVAISISGLWLIDHTQEFNYLLKLQEQKKLDITWVNHTFSHIYYSDLPDKKNFLLTEMINLDTEILLTEQYLLEHNQTPSVFFRFPGLVSNTLLLNQLKKFGLIPLSADAWLAKDEQVSPGGIVLVHGNGNEPLGIRLVTPLLNSRHWVSLPGHV